jgi:hypothetical protein
MNQQSIVWSGEMNRREDYFQGVILGSDIVRLVVEPSNRDRVRGKSLERKANAYVRTPLTVEEHLRRGLRKDDLAWDYQREFITISNASGTEIRDDPTRASVTAYLQCEE